MCDSFVVVSADGVLFGKNSDRDPNEAQRLDWVAAADHPDGAQLACTWMTIPQARHSHAVVLSRPYWMWGAEMGANDQGVVIGNEAVFTRARRRRRGLLGMDLVRLGLERGASAEEAASVIEGLVERYGQGGRAGYDDPHFAYDNSFLIADRQGAIVLETAGREHARERVTSGIRAISNGLTIEPFARDHAEPIRGAVAQCRDRRARVESLAQSVEGPADVARVLRDHGEGRDGPRYHPLNGAMSAPCMHAGGMVASSQTVGSFIASFGKAEMRLWATGTSAPCLSAFKPIALNEPLELGEPTGLSDDRSVWWRFEALHRRVIGDRSARASLIQARDAWERWDEGRTSKEAWQGWSDFVTTERERLADTRDERPGYVRRYWRARERDAAGPIPKLPARSA